MLLNWATRPLWGLHTRAPIGLYTEVLGLSSRVPRTEEVAMRREGLFGSEPVFHGDNNIYHHRGGKEGDRGMRQK